MRVNFLYKRTKYKWHSLVNVIELDERRSIELLIRDIKLYLLLFVLFSTWYILVCCMYNLIYFVGMHSIIYVLPYCSGAVFFSVRACLLSGVNITKKTSNLNIMWGTRNYNSGSRGSENSN